MFSKVSMQKREQIVKKNKPNIFPHHKVLLVSHTGPFTATERLNLGSARTALGPDRNLKREQISGARFSGAGIHVSLPEVLLLCFFHAVDEALPPLILLPPPSPLLLTFELWTECGET